MARRPKIKAADQPEEPGKPARVGLRHVALRRGVPLALGGLIVTGAGTAWALTGDSGPDYRTAVASIGSVDQLTNFTGTVATMGRASAAFGVAGTVDEVSVAPGDKVEKGEVLATLDKEDLKSAVRAAQATLAEAQATLETDSSSSSDASGSSGSSGAPSSGGSGVGGAGSGGSGSPGGSADAPSGNGGGSGSPGGSTSPQVNLTPQVDAVNAARTAAQTALSAATVAMTEQESACADVLADDSEEPEATPTPTPTPEATPSGSEDSEVPSDDTADDSGDDNSGDSGSSDDADHQALLDCIDGLKAVQTAQTKVATAQAAVDVAGDALTTAMNDAVKKLVADAEAAAKQADEAAKQAAKQATEQATAAAKAAAEKAAAEAAKEATAQQAANSPNGAGGTSEVEKAARVAVAEAAVSSAEAALAAAQEDLADAVLRAPVAGVVGDVPFTEDVAASASDAISLLGADAVEVTINVPLTTAAELSKGMAASVTADGAEAPAAGTVNTIGVLPDTSSSTATYPVTILVSQPSLALAEGAAAAVSLTLKTATDVVTVPNSALTPTGTGSTSFITLIQDGKPVRRTVTTGAVGETRTAVTEGLATGDTVILADAGADVPASSTTSNQTGIGGGQFPGGGASFAIPSGGGFAGGTSRSR